MKKIYTLEVRDENSYDPNILHHSIPTLEIIESLCKYYLEEEGYSATDLLITESYSYSDYKISVTNKERKGHIRLLKAAKELDVSTKYIVEILKTLDIFIDNKPTAKLSLEHYEKLQAELVKIDFIANMEER